MTKQPVFDLHFSDGLALLDLSKVVNLSSFPPSKRSQPMYQTLSRAVADIERLKKGWRPGEADLFDAPVLSSWSFAGELVQGSTYLRGIVIGHPTIRSGSFCTTSVLVAIDAGEWKWARTISRFYQIGSKAPSEGTTTQ